MQDGLDGGGRDGWLNGLFASRRRRAGIGGWAAFEAKADVLQDERFALLVYDLDLRPALQFASCRSVVRMLPES